MYKRGKICTVVIITLFGICLMMGYAFHDSAVTKSKIMDVAEKNNYDIEFEDEDEFMILQDDVKYYFKCGMTKVKFDKYETVVEAVEDCNIVDNKGYITVISHDKDTVEVIQEDDYIDEIYGGEESTFHERIRFVCDSDFSKESIDEKYHAAAIGKGEKEYNRITNNFITVERLKELYENGLELSECINENVKNTT